MHALGLIGIVLLVWLICCLLATAGWCAMIVLCEWRLGRKRR